MSDNNSNYLTVSEALEKYMVLSGNFSASAKMQYSVRALEIWKDIRNNVLKTTSHKWVQVNKSVLPYRVELPKCASMFLNITIKNDCGEYVSLDRWSNMIDTPYVDVVKKCSCDNELKSCIESTEVITETISMAGGSYDKITTTKVYANGDVYIETSTPHEVLDENGDAKEDGTGKPLVENIIDKKMICKLQTKECGCIELSQENLQVIEKCFCTEILDKCKKACDEKFTQPNDEYLGQNKSGYFSHSEPNRFVTLYGAIPNQVLVNFKTKGDAEEDELIPDYAFMTFIKGMDWINSRYSKMMNRLDKNDYERDYKSAKSQLELDLPRNKFISSNFGNPIGGVFNKW